MTAAIPKGLADNPILSRWVRFERNPDRVVVHTGKVEIGQGIATALLQIASDALGLPPDRLDLVAGDTDRTPDEGWTSASISIEVGGAALKAACAETRELFRRAAAARLGQAPHGVLWVDGTFTAGGGADRLSYWDLLDAVDLDQPYQGLTNDPSGAAPRLVGVALQRIDLPQKITGSGLIHDLDLPQMLHARVVRPFAIGARLVTFNRAAAEAVPGVAAIVVDGGFIGVCAEREEDAIAAAQSIAAMATWSASPAADVDLNDPAVLHELPQRVQRIHRDAAAADPDDHRLSATYAKPFIAHASIGLCCALADWHDGRLTVWSHTQGVFPLRRSLARTLGFDDVQVRVVHAPGAGCYGHNGADDAALDAALLARALARPVRVVWTREQELAAAPLGSAMLVDVEAFVRNGEITAWRQATTSLTHLCRPGWGKGVNLLAAEDLAEPHAPSAIADPEIKPFGGGGARNALPLYVFPGQDITYNLVMERPVRTSALRSLGAFANVFAIECHLDDVAVYVGADPIAFRLRYLHDERAAAVLEEAARLANWGGGTPLRDDQGRGVGFARYKNTGAYCAVIAQISMTDCLRVDRVWAAVDAGRVVNPDGLRNQIEGGIVQAASWTLKESVRFERGEIATRSWQDYPILNFDETPDIQVSIIELEDAPSLGVGECAAGPTAAAIGNALFNGLRVRVRRLPLTTENILAAMELA